MNVNVRILNEIVTNSVQQYIKIIQNDQVWFIPGMQSWFNM